MCWIGRFNLEQAKEDIPIFKIVYLVDGTLHSIYQNYLYTLNEEVTSEIQIRESRMGRPYHKVDKALHSYIPSLTKIELSSNKYIIRNPERFILDGYDANTSIRVNGIIPKDAMYCINEDGECISDKIILTEIAI